MSYGQQRRLEIARAMCTAPEMICLDEPAAGLNPVETATLSRIIRFLRQHHGITVLLIEHDMGMVMEISDRVIVLDHGDVIARGTPQEIQHNEAVNRRLPARRRGAGGMSEAMLEFREVDVFYGPIQALRQVSLQVNAGETVALIGANGAGKSTLLMSIFGQPRIAGGQIPFGGDISRRSTHYVAAGGIAQAPEGRRIFRT